MEHPRPRCTSRIFAVVALTAIALSAPTIVAKSGQVKKAPMSSSAPPDEFCLQYADRALLQVRENHRLKCEFIGPRWDANSTNHWRWCRLLKGNYRDATAAETNARAKEIETCKVAQQAAQRGKAVTNPAAAVDDVARPVEPADLDIKQQPPSDSVFKKRLGQP